MKNKKSKKTKKLPASTLVISITTVPSKVLKTLLRRKNIGKKTTKAEKIEPASTSTVNEEDIQKEESISLDGISLALGRDDSNLINPIDTNRNLIA